MMKTSTNVRSGTATRTDVSHTLHTTKILGVKNGATIGTPIEATVLIKTSMAVKFGTM